MDETSPPTNKNVEVTVEIISPLLRNLICALQHVDYTRCILSLSSTCILQIKHCVFVSVFPPTGLYVLFVFVISMTPICYVLCAFALLRITEFWSAAFKEKHVAVYSWCHARPAFPAACDMFFNLVCSQEYTDVSLLLCLVASFQLLSRICGASTPCWCRFRESRWPDSAQWNFILGSQIASYTAAEFCAVS